MRFRLYWQDVQHLRERANKWNVLRENRVLWMFSMQTIRSVDYNYGSLLHWFRLLPVLPSQLPDPEPFKIQATDSALAYNDELFAGNHDRL